MKTVKLSDGSVAIEKSAGVKNSKTWLLAWVMKVDDSGSSLIAIADIKDLEEEGLVPNDKGVRKLRLGECVFELKCSHEDVPIKGSFASGDEALDAKTEADIKERLNAGDIWAWCCVEVRASWGGFVGRSYLGCCSYKSEEDFRKDSGQYNSLKQEALDDMQQDIESTERSLRLLR